MRRLHFGSSNNTENLIRKHFFFFQLIPIASRSSFAAVWFFRSPSTVCRGNKHIFDDFVNSLFLFCFQPKNGIEFLMKYKSMAMAMANKRNKTMAIIYRLIVLFRNSSSIMPNMKPNKHVEWISAFRWTELDFDHCNTEINDINIDKFWNLIIYLNHLVNANDLFFSSVFQ